MANVLDFQTCLLCENYTLCLCACVLSQTKRNLIALQQQTLIQSLSATNGAFRTVRIRNVWVRPS